TMNSSGDLHFPVDFSAGFHLWTLEWTRREIRWLLDGKQFHHVNIDRSMWSGKGKNPYTANGQPLTSPSTGCSTWQSAGTSSRISPR
ncbi:hypothetical protein TYRP_023692, partial [Tyrophagus putrescentiae]